MEIQEILSDLKVQLIIGIIAAGLARFFEHYVQTRQFTSLLQLNYFFIIISLIVVVFLWSYILRLTKLKLETQLLLIPMLYWITKESWNFFIAKTLIYTNASWFLTFTLLEVFLVALPFAATTIYFYKKFVGDLDG